MDLHNEIDTLLEIWRDYRNETMTSLNQIKQSSNKNLPEPPNIRETLKKEIKFFVKQMFTTTDCIATQLLQFFVDCVSPAYLLPLHCIIVHSALYLFQLPKRL